MKSLIAIVILMIALSVCTSCDNKTAQTSAQDTTVVDTAAADTFAADTAAQK